MYSNMLQIYETKDANQQHTFSAGQTYKVVGKRQRTEVSVGFFEHQTFTFVEPWFSYLKLHEAIFKTTGSE